SLLPVLLYSGHRRSGEVRPLQRPPAGLAPAERSHGATEPLLRAPRGPHRQKMSVRTKALPEEVCVVEEIPFVGHSMVRSTHARTIEVTTKRHLTPRGDCIIGVGASKGVAQLSASMKRALRSDDARLRLTIVAPGGELSFHARG